MGDGVDFLLGCVNGGECQRGEGRVGDFVVLCELDMQLVRR